MSNKKYKIAAVHGDGIGHEIVPAGLTVLEAAAENMDLNYSRRPFYGGLAIIKSTENFYLMMD